jgi:hypothetical protein
LLTLPDAAPQPFAGQEWIMKTTSALALTAAMLLSAVAFAQTPSSSGGSDNSDISQNNAPANSMPSKATDQGSGTDTPQAISQSCHKQASDKHLTGDDKTSFIKQCKQGKTSRSGN